MLIFASLLLCFIISLKAQTNSPTQAIAPTTPDIGPQPNACSQACNATYSTCFNNIGVSGGNCACLNQLIYCTNGCGEPVGQNTYIGTGANSAFTNSVNQWANLKDSGTGNGNTCCVNSPCLFNDGKLPLSFFIAPGFQQFSLPSAADNCTLKCFTEKYSACFWAAAFNGAGTCQCLNELTNCVQVCNNTAFLSLQGALPNRQPDSFYNNMCVQLKDTWDDTAGTFTTAAVVNCVGGRAVNCALPVFGQVTASPTRAPTNAATSYVILPIVCLLVAASWLL